jgi:hypothetical protein
MGASGQATSPRPPSPADATINNPRPIASLYVQACAPEPCEEVRPVPLGVALCLFTEHVQLCVSLNNHRQALY